MQQPIHAITQVGKRWTRERIVGVGFVGVLHVIAISAILAGLTPVITRFIEKPIHLMPVKTEPPQPPTKIPRLKDSELPKLTEPSVAPDPVINIERDKSDPVLASNGDNPPQPPVVDTSVMGIGNTHTIPAYPSLARRLGEQGRVRLDLTISAAGDVTRATVVQSSGFSDLDQAAIDWVIAHWKYKPATHDGAAVPSQAMAMVVFNLQNAR